MKLSKFLSYVCRHGAHDQGLTIHEGVLCVCACVWPTEIFTWLYISMVSHFRMTLQIEFVVSSNLVN